MIARVWIILVLIGVFCCSCDEWRAVDSINTDLDDEWGALEEQLYEDQEETPIYVEVAGHYVSGFETSNFYPCGSDESWWVIPEGGLREKYYEIYSRTPGHPRRLFVRLGGMRSGLGRYGHLGGADRNFKVMRVFEIRVSSERDCN